MNNFDTEPQEAALTDLDSVLKFIDPDLTQWNFWTGIPSPQGLKDVQCRYGTFGELDPWLVEQSQLGHRICVTLGRNLIPLIEPGVRRLTKDEILKSCGIEIANNDNDDEVFPYTDANIEIVKDALEYIPADEYSDWKFNVGMPLHDWTSGDPRGLEIWDDWSRTTGRNNYHPIELRRQWRRGFRPHSNPRTILSLLKKARDNGWPGSTVLLPSNTCIPSATDAQSGNLTDRTIESLRGRYREINTNPSLTQWHGLRSLCAQLEAQANGTAERLLYVCPLDPGVGKTTVIEHFTKHLLASPAHRHVGVLILVRTYQDIDAMVSAMSLSEMEWGHFITDDLNDRTRLLRGRGNPNIDNARVLFSTHPMLESRARRYGSFKAIREFYFHRQPRAVRVWDEACLPARPITIRATLIDGMKEAAAKRAQKLYEIFNEMTVSIANAEDGDFVRIPNLEESGIDVQLAKDIFRRRLTARSTRG